MKCAIVTGVSRGIGRAVAEMLLDEGWFVQGVSRTPPLIAAPMFRWARTDLERDSGMVLVGQLDALVHCAGIRGPYGPLAENEPDEWERTIQTNLIGTYRVVRAALPLLERSDDGRILLFSGGGAFSPEPGYSAYAATKGATVALMETLAEELRGRVGVNCVAPGFVATDIHRGTPLEGKSDGGHAMQRAVACVRHLLSPDARGLTGKTVSAQWDSWSDITQETVGSLNASPAWTRDRHKVAAPAMIPA
jgi:NAD(P)-dependent dehydrogenase (short-subunit alcohol dehydrogenase family)